MQIKTWLRYVKRPRPRVKRNGTEKVKSYRQMGTKGYLNSNLNGVLHLSGANYSLPPGIWKTFRSLALINIIMTRSWKNLVPKFTMPFSAKFATIFSFWELRLREKKCRILGAGGSELGVQICFCGTHSYLS